jgi:ceramide glucosyltransferase
VTVLADIAALLTCAGLLQAVVGWLAVRRFAQAGPNDYAGKASYRPPVTILKPLHGDEPMLERALASICMLDYPDYQIVFGVQSAADPALAVLARLRERFPERDIHVVIDAAQHGANRKVGNLINMFPFARHDVLVIADSDVHCAPDYLDRVTEALAEPGVGISTMLYGGVTERPSLAGALGASWINHNVIHGVLMAHGLGRQDCLGATMAMSRRTLESIGGLRALVDRLADDNALGQAVVARGLRVRIAATATATTVPETSLSELFRHELRWARTILAVAPVGYALSTIQFVLFWALLALVLSGAAMWSIWLFAAAWLVRGLVVAGIDHSLGLTRAGMGDRPAIWLLPLRDVLSMAIMVASYAGDQVEWRGQTLRASRARIEADDNDSQVDAASVRSASAI